MTIGIGSSWRIAFLLCLSGTAPTCAHAGDAAPGDRTVAQICSACHGHGLLGAPRIGDALAWRARLKNAGSVDHLVLSAAHGKGNMPPRGGQQRLSDDDLKAAIEYMLSRSGA